MNKNRKSPRWQNWDYSADGYYFVTVVTKDRLNLFGEIVKEEVILSDIGQIVMEEWNRSFQIRKELFCDEFIIMPNHIHAILIIDRGDARRDARPCVPTGVPTGIAYRPPKSISSFFAGFKSIVTKRVNEFKNTPGMDVWQSRFHDRIIRDEQELFNVRNYIKNNPKKWNEDEFYKNAA